MAQGSVCFLQIHPVKRAEDEEGDKESGDCQHKITAFIRVETYRLKNKALIQTKKL